MGTHRSSRKWLLVVACFAAVFLALEVEDILTMRQLNRDAYMRAIFYRTIGPQMEIYSQTFGSNEGLCDPGAFPGWCKLQFGKVYEGYPYAEHWGEEFCEQAVVIPVTMSEAEAEKHPATEHILFFAPRLKTYAQWLPWRRSVLYGMAYIAEQHKRVDMRPHEGQLQAGERDIEEFFTIAGALWDAAKKRDRPRFDEAAKSFSSADVFVGTSGVVEGLHLSGAQLDRMRYVLQEKIFTTDRAHK